MPKLYSSDYIVKVILRLGFEFVSQKGSHAKFRKGINPVLTVIVPMSKKEIPFGTFRSILRQANLTTEDFM
jgi:predicted RNA binding protein YcfA (HicA-like mRNA interferase family)|nr:type II toxin-antitoxin system HicA family toxin [uncultured Emticicia sp.]